MSELQSIENLEGIKKKIESMNKFHQIEILKILSKDLCKINENKSGCYINMSFLSNETLAKIKEYSNYTKKQEETINNMETQKEEFKNAFFIRKDNKDETPLLYTSLSK
jgi:hypothetical protein